MTNRVFIILLAAGSGSRFGSQIPKCFIEMKGEALLEKSFAVAKSVRCDAEILIAVPAALFQSEVCTRLKKNGATIYIGGATRRESVQNAFNLITGDRATDVCLIHDAARVHASVDLYHRVLDGVKIHHAVTSAVQSVDSLKEVSADGKVIRSLQRDSIYTVQTPQGFSLSLLKEAHKRWFDFNSQEPTDDASMVEQIHPVHIIEGEYSNKKITFAEDL